MPPLLELLPPLALTLAIIFVPAASTTILWASIAVATTLIWWFVVYRQIGENLLYAFAYPLGALALLYIFFTAVIRGRRVTWKGRTYISQ
jgi:hypothetical protein